MGSVIETDFPAITSTEKYQKPLDKLHIVNLLTSVSTGLWDVNFEGQILFSQMQVLFYLVALLEGFQGHLLIISVLTEWKKRMKGSLKT